MPNEDFENGRRIEKIVHEIEDTRFLIDTSSDLWTDEINTATLSILYINFLELARKYDLSQNEIDRITDSISQYITILGTA